MGARRTLLRHQDNLRLPTKKNRRAGHKITEKPGTPFRRSTPEIKGTKSFLMGLINSPRAFTAVVNGKRVPRFKGEKMYLARYHFTKGWRVNAH